MFLTLLSKIDKRILLFFFESILRVAIHLNFSLRHQVEARMSLLLSDKNKEEITTIFRNYIHNLSVFIVEYLGVIETKATKKIKDMVFFRNLKEIEILLDKHKVLICYCGHFLNHEILTTLPLHTPKILLVCIYKPSSHTNKMERKTIEMRERYGAVCISATSKHFLSDLRNIIMQNKDKNILIGVLNDVFADSKSRVTDIEFNGITFKLYSGIENIGRLLNAQFVYSRILPDTNNHYTVEFVSLRPVSLNNHTMSYTRSYFNELIGDIQNRPSTWMLWGAPSFLGNIQ